MRHIKTYQIFEASSPALTPEQIDWLDECTAFTGAWEVNPQTGLVDVNGSFYCSKQGLTDFRGVRFGVVKGDFFCDDNQLASLEGAPQEDVENFICEGNPLTSLKGAPKRVWLGFYCNDSQLTSLEGAPLVVGASFYCNGNQLTSLEGAPQSVGGSFNCSDNSLTSLEGLPEKIGGSFYCRRNPVSEITLGNLCDRMLSGRSWEKAVAVQWADMDGDDRALVAKHHPELTPEEKREYAALGRHKRRLI